MRKVKLTAGTRVGLDTGEKFEWGGSVRDWFVVGEDEIDDCLTDAVWVIEREGLAGSTMNGCPKDWHLRDVNSGIGALVTTYFSRPETATFIPVA